MSGSLEDTSHPFYPKDLKLENYVPNKSSSIELLGVFFSVVLFAIILLWVLMAKLDNLQGRFLCKTKISWFFMCALIHTFLEGYFAVFYKTIPSEDAYLSQMWKEYGKGDSRYMIGDSFTVCMEGITAFVDGPLAFLATYAFLYNKPYRYVIQLILSLCQLYGDVLYFMTEVKDGFTHGPLGHPQYFWFYFVFMNTWWIVVPLICILESFWELSKAQLSSDSVIPSSNSKKRK